MKTIIRSLFILLFPFACNTMAHAADEYSAMRCGADVTRALIGKKLSNEPAEVIAKRHRDLNLEYLGGDTVTDDIFLNTLRICGDEYAMLSVKRIIKDVLKFPEHSRSHPAFVSPCQRDGKKNGDTVIGVMERSGKEDLLPVRSAWRIDEKQAKFVKIETSGLLCGREGISTADGGQ
jgi:hypothetical protein